MRSLRWLLPTLLLLIGPATVSPAAAQDSPAAPALCREVPCAVTVDFTRAGGPGSQTPDRRYGNPTRLEHHIKARLTERGFTNHGAAGDAEPRFLLVPALSAASCDEMPGTSTDMSCKAITEIEVRLQAAKEVIDAVDIPSRIRNRCSNGQNLPVDRLGAFLADWIIYSVDGRAKGERRPMARC